MNFACHTCGEDAGRSLVCRSCIRYLKPGHREKLRAAWHRIVVERANCACEECGHSAPFDSGELCGDHIRTVGSRPDLQFDVTNGRCVCLPCHNRRHSQGLPKKNANGKPARPKKFVKPAICKRLGCPVFALGSGKRPDRCFRHQ